MSELPHWTEPASGKEVDFNDAHGVKPVFNNVEVAGTGELVQNQPSTKNGVTVDEEIVIEGTLADVKAKINEMKNE